MDHPCKKLTVLSVNLKLINEKTIPNSVERHQDINVIILNYLVLLFELFSIY